MVGITSSDDSCLMGKKLLALLIATNEMSTRFIEREQVYTRIGIYLAPPEWGFLMLLYYESKCKLKLPVSYSGLSQNCHREN